MWELFITPGRPATFDSSIHISNIAQFSKVIEQKEFPVVWLNNTANYGLPIGIVAQQFTSYLGGLLNLITNNPITTYNLLIFIAIFLSNIFLYFFLRFYFSPLASFLSTFIFTFTPYHILNIYIRGAMVEFFSGIFLPLILISFFLLIVKRKFSAFFLLTLSIAGLTLTHPMMLIVYSFLFIPYLFFLLIISTLPKASKIKLMITSFIGILLGLFISSYYIFPLNLEIKYFYYGLTKNHFEKDYYLSFINFFSYQWYYFTDKEIFVRGNFIIFGLLETIILILGLLYVFYKKILKKSKDNINILSFILIVAILIIFFTTKYSDIFFQKIFFLNNIQFPWRFLSVLIFIPPIIFAFLYDLFSKKIIALLLISIVAFLSFGQLYGKNFSIYPNKSYLSSKENLYSIQMNTIWTGKSENYPDREEQGGIIMGKGEITRYVLKNSSRNYDVYANTPLRMIDRTFYFPGWNVYVDNVKTDIEFQDPNYRGVITYNVPAGKHTVLVAFEDTKIRLFGKILSIISLSLFFVLFFLRKRLSKIFNIFKH
ncbi:hypothetical protein KKG52_01900 [Patescibacteria group bacterium]|nr:hypothetical protein [Patescibacteria group bacterium]